MPRDEFPSAVKWALAARAGFLCSNPECRASTIGPGDGEAGVVTMGRAAHITAASRGGPRYDDSLMPAERRSIDNGVWLCASCGDLVDDATERYSVAQLRAWKHQAEQAAERRVGRAADRENIRDPRFSDEELAILAAAAKSGEIALMSTGQTGRFVAAGTENFIFQNDPSARAAYLEAFESLRDRWPVRLVQHEDGILYRLTGSGFKLARAIAG